MKRFFLFNALILFFFSAQSQTFPQGSMSFSAGYGVLSYGNIAVRLIENELNYKPTSKGPFYFKGEYYDLEAQSEFSISIWKIFKALCHGMSW